MSNATQSERVINFSAGPATLPLSVLETISNEMTCLQGVGASILEISHRSKKFIEIYESAKSRVARLLSVPEDYEILFLQGGARLQFSMTAMNLMPTAEKPAEYVITGTWGKGAEAEAAKIGATKVVWNGTESNFDRLPTAEQLTIDPSAAYVHITSNETIQGVQFQEEPDVGSVPLVCDCSSDIFYRPLNVRNYGLIYACAQKNAGPAGVTMVIVRKDLLERATDSTPGYLLYRNHAAANSMWNTPPTFAIYVLDLVAKWLEEEIGGLDKMHQLNKQKSSLLYDIVDANPGVYLGHAQKDSRSLMNVTFRFNDDEIQSRFLDGAKEAGLDSLKGHRSVGGIRASIYNAMPMSGVEALANYMQEFARHG